MTFSSSFFFGNASSLAVFSTAYLGSTAVGHQLLDVCVARHLTLQSPLALNAALSAAKRGWRNALQLLMHCRTWQVG